MQPASSSNLELTLPYNNPENYCWFVSFMACLSGYAAFQQLLSMGGELGELGPVTSMLNEHFKEPPLVQGGGKNMAIDTVKVLCRLRAALQSHLATIPQSQNFSHAKQLLDMINGGANHDPAV